MNKKKVTVIVSAHNEKDYIARCLNSIMEQTLNPIQVIVILDRCTDDTKSIVRKYSVQLIEKHTKKWENSYAENLEIARKKTIGDYFAIVDADVELEQSYFEKTTSEFNKNISAVSGRMVTSSKGVLGKIIRFWERTYYFSPFQTLLPAGCALVVKKKFLDKIGGFEDVPSPDTYLQQKSLEKGLIFIFTNKTKVFHHRELTLQRIISVQVEYGKRRRLLGIPFWKTILHSFFRLRPFVLYGWLKGKKTPILSNF